MNSRQDLDHLRLLSIFHYVVAGLVALFSLFPIFHLIIGIAIVTGQFDEPSQGQPPPEFFGWIFVLCPAVFILCGLAMAVCIAIAGRRLASHTGNVFCLVVAGLECVFMPFSTVLGVFTIVVLMRQSVKELFGVAEPE